jgi:diguanylate cyclase (GGDEF)-like protein
LNDLDSDPSQLLRTKLDEVTDSEHAVRGTAFVLVPLGLIGVVVCGWMLTMYRRRSEATMREALEITAIEARTDQLTGLPNRRAVLEEIERRVRSNDGFTLALADLNGFKRYNDTYGHPAGDALLRRLGRKLEAACEGRGIAARLGGDEFCVLLPASVDTAAVRALMDETLHEQGEGFEITAACGAAAVPAEALGLTGEEITAVERAARFHDLGKVAIPSAILNKGGPRREAGTRTA